MSTITHKKIISSLLQGNCEQNTEDDQKTLAIFTYITMRDELVYKLLFDFNNVLDFISSPYVKSRRLVWEINYGLTQYGKKLFPEITNLKINPNLNHNSIRVKNDTIYIGKKLKFTSSVNPLLIDLCPGINSNFEEFLAPLRKIYPYYKKDLTS